MAGLWRQVSVVRRSAFLLLLSLALAACVLFAYAAVAARYGWREWHAVSLVVAYGSSARIAAEGIEEKAALAFDPSGERAFSYGEEHFNGQDAAHYDIALAEYFFDKAEALDPSLLYIHHELARVYFMRGDFGDALAEIDMQIAAHGDATPNSYYVRGLIEGYAGDYDAAALDYERFLRSDPHDWAGLNDYAWVLLKAGRVADAERASAEGLAYFPANPWLLNSNAIALYELGDSAAAQAQAAKAWAAAQGVSEAQWLHSYPGNDPAIAQEGIASLRASVEENMHTISPTLASSTVQ